MFGCTFLAHSLCLGAVFSFVSVEIYGLSIEVSWWTVVVWSLRLFSVRRLVRSAILCRPVPFIGCVWFFLDTRGAAFCTGDGGWGSGEF